jgi:hypothetical protein
MSIKRTNTRVDRRGSGSEPAEGNTNSKARKKEISWQDSIAGKSDADFVSYTMQKSFGLGMLLDHPKFGKGVVLNVDGKKMEVLFAEGKRLLVMGMA